MSESSSTARFLIQVDRPGEKVSMSDLQELFRELGIELDTGYGPILISPKSGRYVVRGTAAPEARAKAESIPGVRFFADAAVKPLGE